MTCGLSSPYRDKSAGFSSILFFDDNVEIVPTSAPAFEESISDASISFTDHSESPILFTVIVPFSLSDFTDKISVVSAE